MFRRGVYDQILFRRIKNKVSYGIHPNTWKYNVCSIKHETNMMRLHKIRVNKIALFFFYINKYAVYDF